MSQPFYRSRLASHGLDVLVPTEEDQATVHRIIYDELCLGVVRDDSRDAYRRVIERLVVAAGAEGIIDGCTEIELLVGPEDSPVPVFPTTRLHVEAAVDCALARTRSPSPRAPVTPVAGSRRQPHAVTCRWRRGYRTDSWTAPISSSNARTKRVRPVLTACRSPTLRRDSIRSWRCLSTRSTVRAARLPERVRHTT